MNNNELAVIITLFVVACVLFIALAIAAFYVGFCIGDSDNRKSVTTPIKQKHKKRKPPDTDANNYIDELNNLAARIDAYDGRVPVVKKDGDRI